MQFLEKLQKSQFLLDTLLPPVPLDLINLSKNCDFPNFSQFLEESQKLQKSQFLLDTLLPPVTLDLINLSKNFDFSRSGAQCQSFRRGLTVTTPLIFGIFLRGVRKIGHFCGGRQGYCVSSFDLFFFSFRTHQTLRSCFPKAA